MAEARGQQALSAQDVAERLNIARNTVYELVKRGQLRPYTVGRKLRFTSREVDAYINRSTLAAESSGHSSPALSAAAAEPSLIICGQDVLLDILSNSVAQRWGRPVLRSCVGSYSGLTALYYGRAQLATAHLWDGDSDDYNTPYVRRLLPGVPALVISLVWRRQGFYVARGNPLGLRGWRDLARPGLRLANREKGAGSRVLLDEKLRLLGLSGRDLQGYDRELLSHHAVASAVGRGEADVGVGHWKAAAGIAELDFIDLQRERYDLIVKKEDLSHPAVELALDIIGSGELRRQLEPLGGYELEDMGRLWAEL